jgi:peptide-methionine (S)-S-oxide reductase
LQLKGNLIHEKQNCFQPQLNLIKAKPIKKMNQLNKFKFLPVCVFLVSIFASACGQAKTEEKTTGKETKSQKSNLKTNQKMEVITLGAGCFWCIESIFQNLKGVEKVVSGYSNGQKPNPTYKEVCTGTTGHAEVAEITFDPSVVSFSEVLEVFFQTHDPTTLNRQGNDAGTQYRSGIFYHTEVQKTKAQEIIKALNESKAYNNPIVTEVTKVETFYPAEDYHQNYFNLNGDQPYCQYVIRPKVDKFKKVFAGKLK